jgi:hypothetical protein
MRSAAFRMLSTPMISVWDFRSASFQSLGFIQSLGFSPSISFSPSVLVPQVRRQFIEQLLQLLRRFGV